MRTRLLLATCGLGIGLLLTGCGGGEPTTLPVQEDPIAAETPGSAATLPSDWPSDVPVPDALTLVNAVQLDAPEGPTWSATFQGSADPGQVYSQLTSDLQTAGFTPDAELGADTGDGGISSWTKGTMRVQVTVLTENGQTGANVTALDQTG